MKRVLKAHTPKREIVSKRGWRLSENDIIELIIRMPPLERIFLMIGLMTWIAQWLGVT